MRELYWQSEETPASEALLEQLTAEISNSLGDLKSLLLIAPDMTRCYSMAGEITRHLYHQCRDKVRLIHIMPAVGTHMEVSPGERAAMFGDDIPDEVFIYHNWQTDTVSLGAIPSAFIREVSGGVYDAQIEAEVNYKLLSYDQVISIGQVVPHEVVGMANYSKNILVGTGGRQMINESHMLGAVCGIENMLGNRDTPVRRVFDYAQEHFLKDLPLLYIQTVTKEKDGYAELYGFFAGASRKPFELASALSQKLNITKVARRAKKVVVYLDEAEMKSTWVGNKGIYRTRKMIADGGALLLLAPGVKCFGESDEIDRAIRETGYVGTEEILRLWKTGRFENQYMVAAHLIAGSSDGRFSVTYATKPGNLSQEEVQSVGYHWMDYRDAVGLYDPQALSDGFHFENTEDEFYFIKTPAVGLWEC